MWNEMLDLCNGCIMVYLATSRRS